MIDFCAVFFSLGYAFFFIKMFKSGIDKYAFLILPFGIMAYLSKITTVVSVGIIMAYYFFVFFIKFSTSSNLSKEGMKVLIIGTICVLLPFYCGLEWTVRTDNIKTLYGQEWLTSGNLSAWNFGLLHEKLNLLNWMDIFKRMFCYFSPIAWLCTLSILVFIEDKQDLKMIFLLILSFLLPIFIFFNLYKVHDYYMMAISPEICIVLGYGIYRTVDYCIKNRKHSIVLIILLLYVITMPFVEPYFRLYFSDPDYLGERENMRLARFINKNSGDKDNILIMDEDWSPEILFYAEREGFMLKREAEETLPGRDYFFMVALKQIERNKETLSKFEPLISLNEIGQWKV
ncbi:MAG: hypothetical protein LBR26_17870, partial [Prevotella sp.]|nr:hypothetical protein [Prevotella sp.]